ncbi:phosphate uptake regulator PhoU [Natrialba hulunbeirensis JCM 10989]|uniref:Phosphate-specific transport system accessory protein PhoU n=1 Tax=Natrialba hulunbeirensis JCM 10989 TaxID=1227493 RepID=L9ZRK7_9EURY|nr:phosphate signaling complex protein PhoU [Natrialba hulunbeirensis]ELY88192.1 phosphate uptake regulator PhoU [Natrialba hulunbeirensis JCM 10989]
MSRHTYQEQLESLRADVLAMSDLVCDRLEQALEAYETKDGKLAERVITGDHEINQLYLDLERDCIDLFALQQPVASDLRFVAASFKIITDLERIADLATNLGTYTRQAVRDRYSDIDIGYIGERVIELVSDAMDAYASDDAAATHDIAARDDGIDELCEGASEIVVRSLLDTEAGDDALLEDVSRMLLTIRDLERIGDHAVNIAARTLYMVENDDELIY